jgi:hypothetical protein
MLGWIPNDNSPGRLFSDESIFHFSSMVNKHNCTILDPENLHVGHKYKCSSHPAYFVKYKWCLRRLSGSPNYKKLFLKIACILHFFFVYL